MLETSALQIFHGGNSAFIKRVVGFIKRVDQTRFSELVEGLLTLLER